MKHKTYTKSELINVQAAHIVQFVKSGQSYSVVNPKTQTISKRNPLKEVADEFLEQPELIAIIQKMANNASHEQVGIEMYKLLAATIHQLAKWEVENP